MKGTGERPTIGVEHNYMHHRVYLGSDLGDRAPDLVDRLRALHPDDLVGIGPTGWQVVIGRNGHSPEKIENEIRRWVLTMGRAAVIEEVPSSIPTANTLT